ncbi:MAG: DegT/DnrJ/EryC1/StrS family aminotransferase [Gracilimonas sp.]|uniref:DegT/DnrJ/EryC1/StrS family aminotransferase n=1 Tax=Gracilimonas sp. TaxID=1974203 RepID=UPI001B0B2F73|nr:DegT/DnrJ/EryC1/StrS family aminotransferase [Gracilimonas sp.]MBO6587213.1 DegT/DnrJ/EryC1/StrS family aminotransferase [Gracilimonas sp.]MBO6614299.1 DegT/DnrJ/EryC1/StrS family aminotransferase [Gracilimonas sp.]
MSIPLLDLNRQYDSIKGEIKTAIDEVLESQYFIMGDEVKAFENEVGAYCNANHAYGCASGSDALLLALMAIDLQPGDYVLTSPFTFFATAGAISRIGGIPVFLDIEKDSYNLDPKQVRRFMQGEHPVFKKLNPEREKIKAIIPVHLYGQMADMDPIMNIAEEYNLTVIEDAAQAIGAEYKGRRAGSVGDFGCFSFFPSKNLGAFGDAGLVTVKNEKLAEKLDILRLHGAKPKYHHSLVGINSRLDTIQAAVLSVKLKYLDEWSERRREIAYLYNRLFEEAGVSGELGDCSESCVEMGGSGCSLNPNKIITPIETTGSKDNNGRHIYHQYTIRSSKRDQIAKALSDHNIGHSVYYPVSLHEQECFAYLGYQPKDCPVSHCATKQAISIPIFPELKEEEIEKVVEVVSAAVKG